MCTARQGYAAVRRYTIARSLDELRGPDGGQLRLPARLDWGPPRSYDLDDDRDVAVMYERVMREASVSATFMTICTGTPCGGCGHNWCCRRGPAGRGRTGSRSCAHGRPRRWRSYYIHRAGLARAARRRQRSHGTAGLTATNGKRTRPDIAERCDGH